MGSYPCGGRYKSKMPRMWQNSNDAKKNIYKESKKALVIKSFLYYNFVLWYINYTREKIAILAF